MELWIRSQDKEDLLNNPLRIYYDNNYEEVHRLKANTYDETICLGTYETKERALEVLDEIQREINDIKKDFLMACMREKGVYDVIAWADLIYQMPEE